MTRPYNFERNIFWINVQNCLVMGEQNFSDFFDEKNDDETCFLINL